MSVTSSRCPTGDGHADYFRIADHPEIAQTTPFFRGA